MRRLCALRFLSPLIIMRNLARRTLEGLWNAWAIATNDITPRDSRNFFPDSSYPIGDA